MDRFMFKLIVKNPSLDELMSIVTMTQKTMEETADAVCSGEQILAMRKTANQIPVAEEVLRYAMVLCSATHPDSDCASAAAKKYVRLGASPRAGQALISAAKVRALMNGRFNVSYSDLNALAFPEGAYVTLTQDALRSAGAELTITTVRAVNTVVKGLPQSLCAMPRFGMTETTDMTALLAALEP